VQKHVRQAPIIPSHGPPEADGDARNGDHLRKWSCGGGSCRRPAYNDRANDERTNHYGRDDRIDDEHRNGDYEHGDDDYDEHGDDDYRCGNHGDDGDGGAAELNN
jgi:hypothetical protein